jgi:hypothetical protein
VRKCIYSSRCCILITIMMREGLHFARHAYRWSQKYRKTFSIFVAIRSSTVASAQAIYFF